MTRKLSPEQVDLLRQLYLDGEKLGAIAARGLFHLNPVAVVYEDGTPTW